MGTQGRLELVPSRTASNRSFSATSERGVPLGSINDAKTCTVVTERRFVFLLDLWGFASAE
jgi:hypothetical protein